MSLAICWCRFSGQKSRGNALNEPVQCQSSPSESSSPNTSAALSPMMSGSPCPDSSHNFNLTSKVLWWLFRGLTPCLQQQRKCFHKPPRANKWDLTHKRFWWPINSALASVQNEPGLSPNSWLISIRGIKRLFPPTAGCIHITLMDSFKGYGTQTLIRLPQRPCCWSLDIGSKWNVTSGKRPEPGSPGLIH